MGNKKKNTVKKETAKKNVAEKKIVPTYKNFIYLLPEDTSVTEMCGELGFLPEEAVEIWTEINVLEITIENRTITFESLKEDLYDEDLKLLEELSMKQIYTCEYAVDDRELMQKVMSVLIEKFAGKIGSDTEDFTPYIEVNEL